MFSVAIAGQKLAQHQDLVFNIENISLFFTFKDTLKPQLINCLVCVSFAQKLKDRVGRQVEAVKFGYFGEKNIHIVSRLPKMLY